MMLLAVGSASAATVTVTSTADAGPGTLRQALANANDGDLIRLPARTYAVTSSDLNVVDAVTIRGAGARSTVLQGNDSVRIVSIAAGLSEVTLSRLTVAGGSAGASDGGGIRSSSNLRLLGVAVVENRTNAQGSQDGGGVHAAEALSIRDSLIAGNTGYNGGGVYANGPLSVCNSTIAGNTAGTPMENGDGGGLQVDDPDTLIANTTIVGNRACDGPPEGGAGIYL